MVPVLPLMVPETVPPVGEAIDTVGGMVSEGAIGAFDTLTVTGDEVLELPAASYAIAVSTADPSATVAEFHVNK